MDAVLENTTAQNIPFPFMLPKSVQYKAAVLKTARSVQQVFYPLLLAIFYLGFVMATIAITRKKIRRYSSAVYLYAMFLFDLVLACAWFLERAIIILNPGASWPDSACPIFGAFKFIGRVGSLFVTSILAIERILVLTNPRRYQIIATPKTAILISTICLVVVTALSGANMDKLKWHGPVNLCAHKYDIEKKWRKNLYTIYEMVFVVVSMCIQAIIIIILGSLLLKKKRERQVDPIQNSISTARQHTDQLNRINLIVFLMSLNCFLFNIPQNAHQILFLEFYFKSRHITLFITVIHFARFFSMLLLGIKAFIIGIAAPKIRREFWLALKCSRENNALKSRGIEINPEKLRQKENASTVLQEISEKQSHTSSLTTEKVEPTDSQDINEQHSTEVPRLNLGLDESSIRNFD